MKTGILVRGLLLSSNEHWQHSNEEVEIVWLTHSFCNYLESSCIEIQGSSDIHDPSLK